MGLTDTGFGVLLDDDQLWFPRTENQIPIFILKNQNIQFFSVFVHRVVGVSATAELTIGRRGRQSDGHRETTNHFQISTFSFSIS